MNILISIILSIVTLFALATPAHAIIFLPAIVLIPIAKIVAVIIGGFSIPALGIGTLWSKLSGKPIYRTIFTVVATLFLLSIILAVILKVYNPDRPLF